jgi:hypothetical protein
MPRRPSASSLKLCAIRVIGQHFTLIAYGCRSLEQVSHVCTSTGASVNIRIFLGSIMSNFQTVYRVAAIFPEHFQSFTVALKKHFFYSFASNRLTYLPNK